MNDIISKLLLKWFNWKIDSVRDEIKELSTGRRKELQQEFEDTVNSKVDELLLHIKDEIEWLWETMLSDIEDAKDDENIDTEVWSNDE